MITKPECVVAERLNLVVTELLNAFTYASDTQSDVWEFAVPIDQLISLGSSETDLRWLVCKGYLKHGREVTREDESRRVFRVGNNLNFSHRTCFILTSVGVDLARSARDLITPRDAEPARSGHAGVQNDSITGIPQWDGESRKLYVDGELVKRFKWPAMNQERILSAFQEENWPERIDDPLPVQPEQDPKRRLADTIKCLNRKQAKRRVCFHGDGTGEGIRWDLGEVDRMSPATPRGNVGCTAK